ncbi:MAG: NADH-quinone oxidoreductase subunit M [Acidobacteria bacterium RIFCSPLOWO2_02_FULL_60_20]|nr:MAG: NADH-quinone oxidoreductase subunit M [Acidobacteria bacterium RIFCSPLOWO2_02_FULL_60_20]
MTAYPVLTSTTFLPLVGAALILLLGSERLTRWIALATTLATVAVSAPLYGNFDKSSSALQFVEVREWIPSLNITYGMGVDGISLPFVFLASLLSVLCIGVSWTAIQSRVREFYAALLVAETAMIGLFAAANLFLFFVFWELMLIPLFLLIGVWGGPGRVYAAVKFLIFTLSGSVLMLVGMIALYRICGTLDFQALALVKASIQPGQQAWLFAAFLAAFAVKVPMFPLHTWLPNAHTEAPTAGSVILAGILLKMGAYGFLRVSLPLFPHGVQLFLKPMLLISAVAIVYGAYVTLVQTDVKRLIAYSSVSHMGFVTLGIFTLNQSGVEGAILQMINHGIISAALFLCVGMIYERTHTREIKDYGGVAKTAPVYSTLLALFCLAAAGTPGLNSFVGEFLIISGAFKTQPWLGAMAVWGVALGTAYIIWFYYRVVMGEMNPALVGLKLDLNAREVATLVPLALLALGLGLYPEYILSYLRVPVAQLLTAGVTP